jgi:hypothetical protein
VVGIGVGWLGRWAVGRGLGGVVVDCAADDAEGGAEEGAVQQDVEVFGWCVGGGLGCCEQDGGEGEGGVYQCGGGAGEESGEGALPDAVVVGGAGLGRSGVWCAACQPAAVGAASTARSRVP